MSGLAGLWFILLRVGIHYLFHFSLDVNVVSESDAVDIIRNGFIIYL